MPTRCFCRFLIAATMLAATLACAGTTSRVSVSSAGVQGNGASGDNSGELRGHSISADGRYVAFHSYAGNLVAADTNDTSDVFVRDRVTGQTSRVSVSSAGTQGDNGSGYPSISADGRYVAFSSPATNLVTGDTNSMCDVFVHDRVTGQTSRVSVSSAGTQGDSGSWWSSISADGRYVAFVSQATNLVAGDTNGSRDIFVRDRVTGQTSRVSVSSAGTQGNQESDAASISADGRYVAFYSYAGNLVADDTNDTRDVFVRDRVTGQTRRVSVSSAGTQGDSDSWWSSISADGRYVAFVSQATNLVAGDTNGSRDIFVRDRVTGQTSRVSVSSAGTQGDGAAYRPSISADGRYVAFESSAANLVAGDMSGSHYGIFVRDRVTSQTSRVSVSSAGTQGDRSCYDLSISSDGRYVAFTSYAPNLVAGDTNGCSDIFVRDLRSSGTTPDFGPPLIRANLHTHSNNSAGTGSIYDHKNSPPYADLLSQAFGFGLDCLGVSDHAEAITSGEWWRGKTLCEPYASGRIALHGFEWTKEPEKDHINVFGTADKVRANNNGEGRTHGLLVASVQEVYKWLSTARPQYGMADPIVAQLNHIALGDSHFEGFRLPPGGAPGGRSPFDVITLAELAITRPLTPAAMEPADTTALNIYYGEKYWRQALAKGWKLAPTLGNDNGGALEASVRRFHTGIYLKSATRSRVEVLKALAARRTFASQDADAEIKLWQGSSFMGSTLGDIPASSKFTVQYADPTDASGSANLKTAIAVLNGTESNLSLTAKRVNGYWQWTITGPKTPRSGGCYLYVRLRQKDDDYILSAPLWFNVKTATAPALSLASVTASATNSGGAQVTFSLSAPASVRIAITNIAGRTIRVLSSDLAGTAGLNTIAWDGKDTGGLPVPNGRYLVQVLARDEGGAQCQGMAACSIQRR